MSIDFELESLGVLALKNAFYEDYSALVNAYLQAAEGLNDPEFEVKIQDMSSVFARNDKISLSHFLLDIRAQHDIRGVCHCRSLSDAFLCGWADQIYIRGRFVFERRDGEWFFVGE